MTELKKQIKEIDKLIEKQYNINNEFDYVILDGIVDVEKYLKSDLKILWILKEPHDKGEHGKFDMRHLIQDAKYVTGLNPNMKATFRNIIYSTFGILNNFISWKKIEDFRNNHELIDILQNIALINIRKLPGEARSKDKEIENAYIAHKLLLLKQIEIINPDVIIGGGTIKHLYTDLQLSKANKKTMTKFENIKNHPKAYFTADNKIIIETCHPAAKINQELYCNNIINGVKYWHSRMNK